MAGGTEPVIFVSSVMGGYSDYREAARRGIAGAGCRPLLIDDVPAQSKSSRNACLDGVQASDAVVLLLGSRYGWTTPSGVSATEEEYQEAVRLHKTILVFKEEGIDPEPEQKDFIRRVEEYVRGKFRKTFDSPESLEAAVREAVEAAGIMRQTPEAEADAANRIQAMFDALTPSGRRDGPTVMIAWTTLRTEEVTDPLLLKSPELLKQVQRLSLDGDDPLLDFGSANRTDAKVGSLQILQNVSDDRRDSGERITIAIHPDGTLGVAMDAIDRSKRDSSGSSHYYYLPPDDLLRRLKRAWRFAESWWRERDPYERHDHLRFQVALSGVGAKYFRPVPSNTGGSMYVPTVDLDDPCVAFDQPRRLSRRELEVPDPVLTRVIEMLDSRFDEKQQREPK